MSSCLLVGATGLVGSRLLPLLCDGDAYASVTVLGRRALGVEHPKVVEEIVDFDRPETLRVGAGIDVVFCALGTTIKKAGSEGAFRKVDFEYPLAIARASREAGATRYVIVTAVGADPESSLFYNRVKGEIEAALAALEFPRGLRIVRPSMLLGSREESRPAERMAKGIMRATSGLFVGALKRYRAIDAADVAQAMANAAEDEGAGVRVYEGADLFALARRGRARS